MSLRRFAIAATLALAAIARPTVARADAPATATFALVVGANVSVDKDLPPLKYADDDAARYFDLFRLLGARTTVLARLDDNTRRLHPQAAAEAREPKKADLDAAFAQLAEDVARAASRGLDTNVYIVYAGHGSVDRGRGYVTLEDARITGADLATAIARVPAKRVHLVVDACSSYFLAYARGAGGKRRAVESFVTDASLAADPRVGLLLSTSSAKESHEWDAFQAGVFSHEVRSGLYGAADADGDGVVTYREIAAFVARANAAIPNEKYRPDVHTRAPVTGDALVDLKSARGRRVEIDGAHPAHYYLEDGRGVRLADLHTAPGATGYLVRPPPTGAVWLRRTSDDRELRVPPLADVTSVAELADEPPRIASRGAAHEAFSSLFSLPFDATVVASYREAPLPTEPDEPTTGTSSLGGRRTAGLVVVGAGTVLAGTGLAFALSAASTSDLPPAASQRDAEEANARISRDNTLAAIFVTSGVAAVAGGALLYLWPSRKVTVSAAPLAGGGFFSAGGSF